ncbi:MAG TPA: hypothetical protein VH044_04980 [Polyangiaceae bacterium]|jgi:modulator of FtsH protease|nr:hypothetical protein [Polyangiaceae bacterium]
MSAPVAGWENFFVAEAGAAAALSGLLFVAVSINLTRILAISHLPGRALESLLIFLSVLVVATFGLVPGQSRTGLGLEIGITGLAVFGMTLANQLRFRKDPVARRWMVSRVIGCQAASVPFIVAGALLVSGSDRGIYWVVPGMLASFGAGVLNAWVLLVEILR